MTKEKDYKYTLLIDLLCVSLFMLTRSEPNSIKKIESMNFILETWEKRVRRLTSKHTTNVVEGLIARNSDVLEYQKDVINIIASITNIPKDTLMKELKREVRHNFIKMVEANQKGG